MTMQISDQLIYNNETYSLDHEILEPFLQEKGIWSKLAGGFSTKRTYKHNEDKSQDCHTKKLSYKITT
jgi:hypothetical protein